MRQIFFFLVLTMCFSSVFATTVQTSEAKIIAINWLNSQGDNYYVMGNVEKVYSKIKDKVTIYYIVTFKPAGWVIVSGSDIAEPVLGYSTNSQFDVNQLPPQVEGWMDGITDEIESAIKNKLVPTTLVRQKWQTYSGKLMKEQSLKSLQGNQAGPLLTTKWGQGRYYNEMAPADAASTAGNGHVWLGCVATAMVQVMKYWGYPSSGMGSKSYPHKKYGTQLADFTNATYNWSEMPDNVTSLNAEVQKAGYHCAVSVKMDFGTTSSGAFLSDSAFFNYFKYNSTVFGAEKARWDDQEWKAQLRREINAGRPIIYSGYNASNSTGHAWVCDGYEGDFFNFNWGWNGNSNGLYLLSSLTPGSSNYSYNQAALLGIEPVYPASIRIPFVEGFESFGTDGISLTGVTEISATQTHTGSASLKLGRESIISNSSNAASLCFTVPQNAELNFWVKRFTPNISTTNQQKAFIMPQYGCTPLIEIFNGDYSDTDWVSYNVDLSLFVGQNVRLLFVQDVRDFTKKQWMYIDDISISGISNNLAPYTPSNPDPSNEANDVKLKPTLNWTCGDPNGDDLIYKVYLGKSVNPPLVGTVTDNHYTPDSLEHSTTFYWKVVADDDSLTTEGPVWSFTTRGIPPTLGNCGISDLASTSVSICGKIVNDNKSVVSSRGICWSQKQNPTLLDNYIEATGTTNVFSCEITGLLPFSKYYYRAFANSNEGLSYSDVLEFTTPSDLPVVSFGKVENVLRSSAMVTGVVNAVNDSSIFRRGVVWSTDSVFNPSTAHVVSEEGSWKKPGNFIINLVNLPCSVNIFFRVFAENSVGISYSDERMFVTKNHAPVVDLDLNNSTYAVGIDFNGSCTEQTSGGKICDSDAEISDLDGDTINQLSVKLLNVYNSEYEFLTFLSNIEGLIIAGDKTQQLKIMSSRNLTYSDWKEVLKSIEYVNNLDYPHPEIVRQVKIQITDGLDSSTIANAFMKVIPVNDPPLNHILPALQDSLPVLGSLARVACGTWNDILDSCNAILDYSYSWQMKNVDGEIVNLNYDNQQIMPIEADLCGSWIRVVEKVTDKNCGGAEIAVSQAESRWYKIGKIDQSITIDPVPDHYYDDKFFTLRGKASSELPISYNVSKNKYISISNDTVFIIGAGSVVVSGVQPGNECYLPSKAINRIVNIEKSDQNIVFEQTVEAKYNEGKMKIPASATSGLGLLVTSSDSSVAYVQTDTIYFRGIGKNTLSISQPGNQNYHPSTTVKMNLTVLKGDQKITVHFPDELFFGKGNYSFSAVSSSLLDVELSSSNPSLVEIDGDSIIVKGVGDVIIYAKQSGNEFWNPASDVSVSLNVKKGIQEFYIEPIGDKSFLESSFSPVYFLNTGLIASFSLRDTSIAVVVDGKIVIKDVGETFIDFVQNGNELWEPAYATTSLKVVKADQIVTFKDIENQLFGNGPVLLSATASSGLSVVFELSNQEIGAILGDSLYIRNAGETEILATQLGNDQFNSASASINLVVERAAQSIVSHLPDTLIFDRQVIFADVVSTSGLKVDIVSSDNEIVKVLSDSLQVLAPGEVLLTLTQPGNNNYLSAESLVKMVITRRVAITKMGEIFFSLYPNPSDGKANLIVNGNSGYPLEVSIVNSTGLVITNFKTINQITSIDLSNQPSGLYFVVVKSNNSNWTQKILIAR